MNQSNYTFDTDSRWGHWRPRGLSALLLRLISILPANEVNKRIAYLLRKPIKQGKQLYYDRIVWGLRLRLVARGNLSEQRMLTMEHFHDLQERKALSESLGPGSIFFDIGANAGFYTFWALSLGYPDLRVVAVEPNSTMTERIMFNLGLNKIHKGEVDVVECALTSSSCKVTVSEHSRNLGETTTHQKTSKTGRQVPGKPLLDLIHETKVSRIDALKIDIEGEEIPALSSFFNHASISLWPRLIICEIFGPDGHLLQKLLEANGYKRTGISKMNAIFRLSQI